MSLDRRLVLIDGLAALYRAFYAIPDLATKTGKPTNAVFGFIRMINQIREIRRPSHWAVVFDGGLPKERLEIMEEYKAQRPPMPDKLREQIDTVEKYLKAADIAWVRMEGEEADDVLASMAEWAMPNATHILIATNDKDIYQLVNEKIFIIPVAGKEDPMGVDAVKNKTGVEPSKITEWLSLMGDTVDNIPGVPGVGPKTAAKLINTYGTLDLLMKHIDEVKGDGLRESIKECKDLITRNMRMVRLRRNLDSSLGWDEMKVRPEDPTRLFPLYKELEFHSYAKEISEGDLFKG